MINKYLCTWLVSCMVVLTLVANDSRYVSQCGQERVVNDYFFRNKRGGVFVDIGAHDGKSGSNTYFFEKELDWTGICFEPMPRAFEKLKENRNCICINACVAKEEGIVPFVLVNSGGGVDMLSGILDTYDPRHWTRMQAECQEQGGSYTIVNMDAVRLDKILQKYGIYTIDYLSVDTEGNELDILQSIDFDTVRILAISVENNYQDPEIRKFLISKEYDFRAHFMGFDELYIHRDYAHEFYAPQENGFGEL